VEAEEQQQQVGQNCRQFVGDKNYKPQPTNNPEQNGALLIKKHYENNSCTLYDITNDYFILK
jgi:hypothetical protein